MKSKLRVFADAPKTDRFVVESIHDTRHCGRKLGRLMGTKGRR